MATATLFCGPCKESGEEQVPVAFCLKCRELYCNNCLKYHRKTKLTESHLYVYLSGDGSGEVCPCDLCNADNNVATSLCVECRELYCTVCTNRHRKFKTVKDHVVLEILSDKSNFNVTYSRAQVHVYKKKKQTQQDGTSVNNEKTSNPNDNKTSHVTEPLHSDNTTRRSDVKQTSLSGTFHCTFSIRTPSDKDTTNLNRMVMPGVLICFVDMGNNKIKLYTDHYVLCDEVCVPWCIAVTCVDDDTVAVATRHEIAHYSMKGNKITKTGRTLHIDGDIYDIAYRRGEFITRYSKHNTDYTCFGSKTIVKQYRQLLLDDFIHYQPVSDCVILGNSCFDENTVTCYTLEGDAKWRVTLDGGPTGMVVVHGVVLLANYSNDCIRQITMDGRLLSTPLLTKDHGITRPHAITYQHKQHRLLVTGFTDRNVMVFNMSQ